VEVEARATGLQRLRNRQGLSQAQLADRLGISLQDLALLESGARRPSRELRRVLMAYFDCNFEDLFEVVSVNSEEAE